MTLFRHICLYLLLAVLLAGCGPDAPSPAATNPPATATPEEAAQVPTAAPTSTTAAPTPTMEPDRAATEPAALPTMEPTTEPVAEPTRAATSEPAAEPTEARTPPPEPGAAYTGTVTDEAGAPIAGAWVYAGDAMARTNDRGVFGLEVPDGAGELTVMAPGYKKHVQPLGGADADPIALEPFVVKALYVSGVGDMDVRQRFYELLDDTELNGIVINVKNDDGRVWTSKVPLAIETGASYEDFHLKEFVDEAHERGIYVIGRFTTFRDPNLAQARPDMAIQSTEGGIWADNHGHNWADPFNKDVWEYFGDLGEEIAASGIDEIQFDYVRFPVDGDLSTIEYITPSTRENRPPTIKGFLEYMEGRLRPHKVFISADTYGLTVWSPKEEGTGQLLEDLAQHLDYYSPMIYPDHFARGTGGYDIPSAHPYEIIYESVERAQARLKGTPVLVRPYLSAFRDTQYDQPFGLEQFRAQKQAAEDAGAHGWIFWNAALTYPDELFDPE